MRKGRIPTPLRSSASGPARIGSKRTSRNLVPDSESHAGEQLRLIPTEIPGVALYLTQESPAEAGLSFLDSGRQRPNSTMGRAALMWLRGWP
jgi:hypothetical protein